MFVERKVRCSALFTNLVGWHAGAVNFPLNDVILADLACPLSYVIFCLPSGITNLSLYKHWVKKLYNGCRISNSCRQYFSSNIPTILSLQLTPGLSKLGCYISFCKCLNITKPSYRWQVFDITTI
jgi:hypothetical protein